MDNSIESRDWSINIFKSTFDYLADGFLTNDEFCELMMCIYNAREKNEITNEKSLSMKVGLVWKTLKNSVKKSVSNSKQYDKKKKLKTTNNGFDNDRNNHTFIETVGTEDMNELGSLDY